MKKGRAWFMFFAGLALCVLALIMVPQWVWIPLPFALTGLALGFDAI